MAKLAAFSDPFTDATINTSRWNSITAGTATLDTVNDLVLLAQPTVSGTTNTFGTTTLFDATGSSIYAEVTPAPVGNGATGTLLKLSKDASNWAAIRMLGGVFTAAVSTAGAVTSQVMTYDPNACGWWMISESGGVFTFSAGADGYNWVPLQSLAYTWPATAVTVAFQTAASATEVAGNVATIGHVNTLQGGPFNINWPTLEEAWAPRWNCNGGDVPLDRYVDVTLRSEQAPGTSRGSQYELDQVQSGEASLILQSKDGALDPGNSAGPWFGHIQPYQPYRKRAQWPPSRNLLTQVQATGGDIGGTLGTIDASNAGPSIFSLTDTTHGSFVASASAWQGGTVMQFAVPAATASDSRIVYTPQPAVAPGTTYSMSARVRNVTGSTSLQVKATLLFYGPDNLTILTNVSGTAATLTGSASAAWSTVTVTATAPAGAGMMYLIVSTAAAAAATCAVQVDGWQLERAAVASSWTCPGAMFPIYGGFVERWPTAWDMGGTYGRVSVTGVDAFSLLSQVELTDPLTAEVNKTPPRFLYALGDPSGSTVAADQTGNFPPAPLAFSHNGSGSLVFGSAVAATNPTTGVYTGSTGTVVTIANPSPGTNIVSAATYLDLSAAGIKGPVNIPGSWTRMLAFRYKGTGNPSAQSVLWSSLDIKQGFGSSMYLFINSSGFLSLFMSGPTGASAVFPFATRTVTDGNWHLASWAFNNLGSTFTLDGLTAFYGAVGTNVVPAGLISDALGAFIDPATLGGAAYNYAGDLSFAAEWSAALSATDMTNIYTAWRTAGAGESTDARYKRILRYAGYIGPQVIQAGLTRSMGPAAIDGQDALSALQAVVDTESGEHFVDTAGNVTFRSRAARYDAIAPVYTFGENTAGGEWPYENCALDFDPTHLSNMVTVTQESTGQVFTAQDATSQTNYFPRTMARTVNSSSALECQDAASYLLSRYKNALTRVSTLVLHPAANPAMWPVCLSLDLGMRVRVVRRPPAAPSTTVDCFIENIAIDHDDQGDATWTLQCSPADPTPYAAFASFHTTLHTTAPLTATSITINVGSDSTNPAAAQIGAGQKLVLSLGTSAQETVTVKSVAATSPGWSTCVVTLVLPCFQTHFAGDVVCEPLPAGVTDPTMWDGVAQFDAVAFAY